MPSRLEVRILVRHCKGCGLCVEFCERGKLYIEQTPNKQGILQAAVRAEVECSGCRRCATICPDAAIEILRVTSVAVGADAMPDESNGNQAS